MSHNEELSVEQSYANIQYAHIYICVCIFIEGGSPDEWPELVSRNEGWSVEQSYANIQYAHIYNMYVYVLQVDPPTSDQNWCPVTRGRQ